MIKSESDWILSPHIKLDTNFLEQFPLSYIDMVENALKIVDK